MTKRFLALLLALIMCASLATCGGDKDKEDEKTSEKVVQSENDNAVDEDEIEQESEIDKRINRIARKENVVNIKESSINPGMTKEQYFYDKDNALIYMLEYTYYGVPMCWYEYDENGQIARIYAPAEDSLDDWLLYFSYNYTYENDRLVKIEEFYENEIANVYHHEYDAEGNLIRITEEYPKNCDFRETIYVYDSIGNCVKEEDHFGNHVSYKTYKYDENGNKTESSTYNTDGELTYSCEYNASGSIISEYDPKYGSTAYEYDSNNRLVKVVAPNGCETTAAYDEKGNCTYIEYGFDGKVTYTYAMEYDADNSPVKWTMTDPSDTSDVYYNYTLVFENDENGFKIKTTKYDNNGNVYSE